VSLRAVLIGSIGIPLNTYWMTLTYWRFGNDAGTPYPVYYNCLFYLFALAGINTILRRRKPEWVFSLGELLTMYVMLSVATAWCGVDLLMPLPEAICNAFWLPAPATDGLISCGRIFPNGSWCQTWTSSPGSSRGTPIRTAQTSSSRGPVPRCGGQQPPPH